MEWLQDVNWIEIGLLLVSGVVVGIINTLGGGGSVITMALFMAMGIPVAVANGTNRIAVVMQNLSATIAFMRKKMLDIKNSLLLGLPTILGTIAGSLFAIDVSEKTFKVCLSLVLAIILIYLILDRGNAPKQDGHSRYAGGTIRSSSSWASTVDISTSASASLSLRLRYGPCDWTSSLPTFLRAV